MEAALLGLHRPGPASLSTITSICTNRRKTMFRFIYPARSNGVQEIAINVDDLNDAFQEFLDRRWDYDYRGSVGVWRDTDLIARVRLAPGAEPELDVFAI